jgi:hypothetical protein
MGRRVQGIVILALTLLIAMIIPRLDGTPISGTPTALSIPPPPTIGACILDNPMPNLGSPSTVLTLRYGECGQAHFGEVVQVLSNGRNFPRAGPAMKSFDPRICTDVVNSYLGVDQITSRADRGDYRSTSFGRWQPVSVGRIGIIEPTELQRNVGQTWIACVTEGATGTPYAGTVRGAFTGGSLPNSYATCGDTVTPGAPLDCATPHRVELFASTPVSTSLPSQAALTSTCTELLQQVTGRTDLVAGGRIQVQAVPVFYGVSSHTNPGQRDSVDTEPGQAFCGIAATGTIRMTSTLFALDNRPLPLR